MRGNGDLLDSLSLLSRNGDVPKLAATCLTGRQPLVAGRPSTAFDTLEVSHLRCVWVDIRTGWYHL